MVYDALGRRVEQPSGGGTAEILYGPDGSKLALMAGQTVTRAFLPLPGGATAVYNSSGLAWYRHPDWLGSSRLASTPPRARCTTTAPTRRWAKSRRDRHADRNFTGQNQDLTPGGDLYDFPYREYHASHGRWISPDPAGLAAVNPANPQSWNRYAYVNGSPLNSVDPLGLDDCKPHGACADQAQQTQMPWRDFYASGSVYNISLIAGDVWFVNPYSGSTVTKVVTPGPNGDGFTISWVSSVDLTVVISGEHAPTTGPATKPAQTGTCPAGQTRMPNGTCDKPLSPDQQQFVTRTGQNLSKKSVCSVLEGATGGDVALASAPLAKLKPLAPLGWGLWVNRLLVRVACFGE